MARTKTEVENTQVIIPDDPTGRVAEAVQAANTLALMDQTACDNAQFMARQLGYDGTLTVGALEDEIRFYQRRTIEACLELGKRLLILKELTPHGEFEKRTELLGLSKRMSQKFMSATLKFSKTNSNSLLKATNTQTKMLELLVLDDGEIEALENGDTVRGLTLDDVETMSVSELKKALRATREDAKAKDAVIKKKDEKLNELDQALEKNRLKPKTEPVEEQPMPGEYQLAQLQDYTRGITTKISATLNSEIVKLINAVDGEPPKHIELAIAQCIGLIITAAYGVAENWRIDPITDAETAADDPIKADVEAFQTWQAQQAGA